MTGEPRCVIYDIAEGGGIVVWHLENNKKPLEVKYVR